MKRKPYPVTQLTKGLNVNLDAVFLTDQESPNLKMVRFDKGLVKKDLGFVNFGTGQRIHNGSMEYNDHWNMVGTPPTCERSGTQKHAGTYSWKVVTDAIGEGVKSDLFSLTAGRSYTGTVWAWMTAAMAGILDIKVRKADNSGYETLSVSQFTNLDTDSWHECSFTFTASVTGAQAFLEVTDPTTTETFYIDDASIACASALDERPMYFDTFYKTDGSEYFICFTPRRMLQYISQVWIPVNGSNIFSGDEDDQFSTSIFKDYFIITNGQDPIAKWEGTLITALGGLGAPVSLTAAKVVISYNSRVIFGNTTEGGTACPLRVRWSATGQEEHWDPATYSDAGFIDLVDTPDWITGFATLVDRLFVFKERSIWEFLPTKDTSVFEARLVIDGVGTYAASTIVSLGDVLIFFGTDDVYLFDGSSLKSVGESVYPWLYTTGEKRVNLSRLNRVASVYIEELGDYVLCLPTEGDDPDWFLKYNTNDEYWIQRDKGVTAFGFWSQGDFTDWSSATGFWDDPLWAVDWKSMSLPPGAPITILGLPDGTIEKDDRLQTSSEQMIWETKDFLFGHSQRIVEVSVKCKGNGPFTIYYSTDKGLTWDAGQVFTPEVSEFKEVKRYFNLDCDQIRFRLVTSATDFQIMWIEPWYIDRTRTVSPIV